MAREAFTGAHTIHNTYLLTRANNIIGNCHRITGQYDSAAFYFNDAYKLAVEGGNLVNICKTLNNLSLLSDAQGDLVCAQQFIKEAIHRKEQRKQRDKELANYYNTAATLAKRAAQYKESANWYQKSLMIAGELKDTVMKANATVNYGLLHETQGNFRQAVKFYHEAFFMFALKADSSGIAKTWNNLGNSHYYLGANDSARYYYQKSIGVKIRNHISNQLSSAWMNLGAIAMDENKLQEAHDWFDKAEAGAKAEKNHSLLAEIHSNLGDLNALENKPTEALAHYEKALAFAEETGLIKQIPKILRPMADLYAQTGQYPKGYKASENLLHLNDSLQANLDKAEQQQSTFATKLRDEQEHRNIQSALEQRDARTLRITILLLSIALLLALVALLSVIFGRMQRARARIAEQDSRLQKMQVEELEQRQQLLTLEGILQGKEIERERIARDLHDRLGGHLSTVKLHLTAGAENVTANQLMDKAVEEVRRIAGDLRSEVLGRHGLAAALEEYASTVNSSDKLKVKVISHGMEQRPEATIETAVYYIAMELLTNVIRHAKATRVTVQLLRHGNNLNLLVEDDGVGFDPRLVQEKGMGLGNVKRRVEALGGTLSIDSTPGKGTTMSVDLTV